KSHEGRDGARGRKREHQQLRIPEDAEHVAADAGRRIPARDHIAHDDRERRETEEPRNPERRPAARQHVGYERPHEQPAQCRDADDDREEGGERQCERSQRWLAKEYTMRDTSWINVRATCSSGIPLVSTT